MTRREDLRGSITKDLCLQNKRCRNFYLSCYIRSYKIFKDDIQNDHRIDTKKTQA